MKPDSPRPKLNKTLMIANTIMQLLFPLIGFYFYYMSIDKHVLKDMWPVTFWIGWIFYLIFIVILNTKYFPRNNKNALYIVFTPIATALLSSFTSNSFGALSYIADAGSSIFISVNISAVIIIYLMWFENLLSTSERNPLILIFIPMLASAGILVSERTAFIMQSFNGTTLSYVNIVLIIFSIGANTQSYYKNLVKVSILPEKKT